MNIAVTLVNKYKQIQHGKGKDDLCMVFPIKDSSLNGFSVKFHARQSPDIPLELFLNSAVKI